MWCTTRINSRSNRIHKYMNVSNILYTIHYADDTCAVLSENDLSDLIKLLHTELCKLSIWLSSNKLSLNTNKTFHLLFHRARINPVKISIEMNGSIIILLIE